jgi:hypothetical protein
MAKLLTQEWLDLQTELTAGLPERPGATLTVQHTVTGTPGGDVAFSVELVDGRLVGGSLGERAAADLTVVETYDDFVRILRGELDESVGFTLLPVAVSPEYRTARAELAARTEI